MNYLLLLFTLIARVCLGQPTQKINVLTSQTAIAIRVPQPPKPVRIQGQTTLVYELYLTNFSTQAFCLKQVQILDEKDFHLISVLDQPELQTRFATLDSKTDTLKTTRLKPGSLATVYLELPFVSRQLPSGLIHRLIFSQCGDLPEQSLVVQAARTPIITDSPLVLSAPLGSGPWAAVYNPSWERGHRRVIFTRDGRAHIPGRFAIDFVKLDQAGQLGVGDQNTITNWYSYGVAVLAVGDGIVASTRTDFVESPTLSAHPKYGPEQATGNYVSIRLGPDQYAFYEHLQPGSIQLKPGQAVRKGDVIGRIGFTGQSTGPHLHFHVATADSPLGAEGVPFVFEQFTLIGSYVNFESFGKGPWQSAGLSLPPTRQQDYPASNTIIRFD